MPLDIEKTLHDALWVAFAGDATVATCKAINLATPIGYFKDRLTANRGAPADYPQLKVSSQPPGTASGAYRTMAMTQAGYSSDVCDQGEPITVVLQVSLTHDTTDLTVQSPLEAAVFGAMKKAARAKFGCQWVSETEIKPTLSASLPEGGTNRRRVEWTVTINGRPMLSALTS